MSLQKRTEGIFEFSLAEPGCRPYHGINSIDEIIAEARAGRCFVLIDDSARDCVADIVLPAQFVTGEILERMHRSARGLIRLALTTERINHLKLQTMAYRCRGNGSQITLSIEAKRTKITGGLWGDRARTIAVAIDQKSEPGAICSPGKLFAHVGARAGVLGCAGRSEGAIAISDFAGLNPSAVLCEVMGSDGPLQSVPDFRRFARHHGLKMAFVSDIVAYRLNDPRAKHPGLIFWSKSVRNAFQVDRQ